MGFLVTQKSKFDDFDYNRNFMDIRINFVENKDNKAEEVDILNNDEDTHKKYDVTCIHKMLWKKMIAYNGMKSLAFENVLHRQWNVSYLTLSAWLKCIYKQIS